MIMMLQKLLLCFNNFYMMYVKYLHGLFGQDLYGLRDLNILVSKLRNGGFYGQFWFLEYKGV